MRRLSLCCGLVLGLACTPTPPPTSPSEGGGGPSVEATRVDEVGFGPWVATLHAEHPLVGTAWAVAEGRAYSRAELEQALATARFVLLGETHDHGDHHRLQGELIAGLLAARPAVAYEMLDPQQQGEIDEFVGAGTRDVDSFAELVGWADSGWPAWALYRPAFAPVIEAGLPIVAAGFPRAQTRRFMSEGLAMLPAELVARHQLDQPLAAELFEALLDEMFVSHCEMVPRESLGGMVEIQRIRDAIMADALLRGAEAHGQAVLVAGTGHTRASGVPRLLQLAEVEGEAIVSVGLIAVDPERLDPRDYGEDFDVIIFTPGVEREDPCKSL
jgi:uncharacterized iron-regulated protein